MRVTVTYMVSEKDTIMVDRAYFCSAQLAQLDVCRFSHRSCSPGRSSHFSDESGPRVSKFDRSLAPKELVTSALKRYRLVRTPLEDPQNSGIVSISCQAAAVILASPPKVPTIASSSISFLCRALTCAVTTPFKVS